MQQHNISFHSAVGIEVNDTLTGDPLMTVPIRQFNTSAMHSKTIFLMEPSVSYSSTGAPT